MADIPKPNFSNALWASGGAIVAPSNVKIQTGWTAEVPPFQWENWSQNRQDQGIAHILQHGIAVWDTLTEYQANTSYAQGSDGIAYRAKQTHSNQNPVTDTAQTYWEIAFATGSLLSVQSFTASGTYTPTPGMKFVIIECQGGGGSGAGLTTPAAGNVSAGAPGTGGTYAKGRFAASLIGASKAVTVGAGGSVGSGVAGGGGGASSVGIIISAPGGVGGGVLNNTVNSAWNGNGSVSAVPTGANISQTLGNSTSPSYMTSPGTGFGGAGGSSFYGPGATPGQVNSAPAAAPNYGSGGAGCVAGSGGGNQTGGQGKSGIVIIWEYS